MAQPAPKQQPLPTQPRRMALAGVIRGKQEAPDRVLIFGVEGIGKSSWAAGADSAIFLPAEDGTSNLDVARFPLPESWQDVLDAIETLITAEHAYRTLVIDTLDAVEPLLWRHICERDKKSGIEDYGYGKGYVAALDEWRGFLAALERLRRARKMGLVLVAHAMIRNFKNPEGEDFDRYELKLHAKAGGLLKEWCDSVLFAHYETFAVKDERKGTTKGVSTGARVVHTQRTAAWDAKNRYSLPESLPLNYDDYAAAVKAHRPADPEKLRESILAKVEKLADPVAKAYVDKFLASDKGQDASELAIIHNRLTAKLSAKGA